MNILKPGIDEYDPYFQRYLDLVGEGDFRNLLHQNSSDMFELFRNIPAEKHDFSYAPGKWTIKEMLMHLIDTERVMGYRALVAARRDDKIVLPPMDEDGYARNADITGRDMESLLEEFSTVKESTKLLFMHMNEDQSQFKAKGATHPVTARAIAYIIIGHTLHHKGVLERLYLGAPATVD